jgi:hypothetical protein
VESVTILRDLWRRRVLVGIVAVIAILAGGMLAYHAGFPPQRRSYEVGVATASVLLDTPKSQVVEIAPKGSDMLGARANVLANLMVDGEIKDAIAKNVGLPAKELVATTDSAGTAVPETPLTARSHTYSTSVAKTSDMNELPIIRVQTQAPDVAGAIKLANAAVAGLSEYLDSRAAAETISDTRRLRVRVLGAAQGQVATRGPGRLIALAVTFVVFMVGCALILAVTALVNGWRVANALEQDFGPFEGDGFPEDLPFDQSEWPAAESGETEKLRAS